MGLLIELRDTAVPFWVGRSEVTWPSPSLRSGWVRTHRSCSDLDALRAWRRGLGTASHDPQPVVSRWRACPPTPSCSGTPSGGFNGHDPVHGPVRRRRGSLPTPSGRVRPPRPPHPEYPFHHLIFDGLWVVRTPAGPGRPGPSLRDLRAGAVGELSPDFARDIDRDPRLFAAVVRAAWDTTFPASLHDDIPDAVGISVEAADLLVAPTKQTRRRDASFGEMVLLAYEYQRAVCAYDGQRFRG
jgi:hypothetical protein